jgi:hypothetical protein
MPRYDFRSLSSQDFEELVRDLLQAEWDVALEAFKTGRDSGIDLRYARPATGMIIIQCKHYAASGFRKLLAHLRDCERPKVERLAPSRYVVVTSAGLTPANKDEITDALQPFVLSAHDVIGEDDLEGLLNRHPDVERANFKLWLTSTSVLERVLHQRGSLPNGFRSRSCSPQVATFRTKRGVPASYGVVGPNSARGHFRRAGHRENDTR